MIAIILTYRFDDVKVMILFTFIFFFSYTVSAVRIFFRDSFFLPKQRRELFETSDLISNFGGILGLFTGFSLFSLAEIIYFIAKPLIQSFQKKPEDENQEVIET